MSAHRQRIRSTISLIALTITLSVALTGCGAILPKKEPLETISPQVHVDPDPAWPHVTWELTVARPTANEMLDSRRLVVAPSPGRIEVYKGVSWDETMPDIVQDVIVHAFEDSGKILSVGHQAAGLRTDYLLQIEIRDNEAVYRTPSAPPEITLVVDAKLVDYATSRAVASHTFHEVVPARATAVQAVAEGFDAALGALAHDLVGWTLANGQQARSAAGTAPKH